MVDQGKILTRGGIYLAKLDPAKIDLLHNVANKEEFVGDTSPRTAAYIDVREDSSTGSTHKLPLEAIYARGLINEVGKIRPVLILNSQIILNSIPPIIFICPLSSQSQLEFSNLHFKLSIRDNLEVTSYALVEHCRSISITRIIHPRLAQATSYELQSILHILQRLVDL